MRQRSILWRTHPARVSHHLWTAGAISAAALLPLVGLAWAQSTGGSDAEARPSAATDQSPQTTRTHDQRIREGTEIVGRSGHFRMTGDRVTFFTSDGKGRFVGLENLNLERIAESIADSPDQLVWSVTATLTEFRGANYLLVRRAVLRSRARPEESAF